jgi:hypothetical protein
MHAVFRNTWLASVVFLLIAAQTGAIAHAYEHDPATSQDLTCSACVSAGNLLSGCVDSSVVEDLERYCSIHYAEQHTLPKTIHVLIVRQRGPPTTL